MRIAYCGPISLHLLSNVGLNPSSVPKGYQYPFGAYLVREYLKRGHEVGVFTTAPRIQALLKLRVDNLLVYVIPQRRYYSFCFDKYRRERKSLVRELRICSPDVIHAQWTYEFADAAIESQFPSLVTARDSPRQILWHMPSTYRLFRAAYGRAVIRRCVNLSTLSPYMRDELVAGYRLSTAPKVIPNGIESSLLHVRTDRKPSSTHTFTCVAGWNRRKNPKPLLQAFCELRKQVPHVRLLLIGSGFGKGGPAERWLQRRGGCRHIEFRGSVPHAAVVRALREETDTFVHPTREEPFGMAVVEAMAAKLPVIAGQRSGAVPWLLDFGRTGLLCDVNSSTSILAGMQRLLHEPSLAQQYAESAYERVKSQFTLEHVASRYLNELSNIAEKTEVPA
jgi:L-malate glycosyltransferase